MSRQKIEEGLDQFQKAFNRGDAAAVAQLYAEDGRFMPPNTEMIQGRAAIESFVDDFVQSDASLSATLVEVHQTTSLCVAVGRYEIEFHPPDADPQADSGKFIEVWARQPDGSWLIAEDIFNSSLPARLGD